MSDGEKISFGFIVLPVLAEEVGDEACVEIFYKHGQKKSFIVMKSFPENQKETRRKSVANERLADHPEIEIVEQDIVETKAKINTSGLDFRQARQKCLDIIAGAWHARV